MATLDTAAQALSDASWGDLGGGTLVFGDDWSGGAWYSAGSRPTLGQGDIRVIVPSRSISVREAVEILDPSDSSDC